MNSLQCKKKKIRETDVEIFDLDSSYCCDVGIEKEDTAL